MDSRTTEATETSRVAPPARLGRVATKHLTLSDRTFQMICEPRVKHLMPAAPSRAGGATRLHEYRPLIGRFPLSVCVAIGCLTMLAACGCDPVRQADYSELGLVEVSGRVTLDGKPLPQANIQFESDDTTFSYGRTDEEGRYELLFNSEQPGCLPGEKNVRITLGPVGDDADPDAGPSAGLPAKYNSESGLRANVSEHQRRFDFDL